MPVGSLCEERCPDQQRFSLCWEHRAGITAEVVVLGEPEMGAIQIRLVATGPRYCGLGIIGDHQLRGALNEFQGLDVTRDPWGRSWLSEARAKA